jgi:hypothetical protein
MKLSDLVIYRNELVALSTTAIKQAADLELNKVTYAATSAGVLAVESCEKITNLKKQIDRSFEEFDQHLIAIKSEIENIVTEQGKFYFQESTNRYEQSINNRDVQRPEYIDLDRHLKMKIPEHNEIFLKTRLGRYANWQCPGMIIHPGQESYIDIMIANDPLYLIDDRHELLEPSENRFNDLYRSRLCKYVITESLMDQPILEVVPDNQFGLCLVYNYLNFRPFEVVKQYLKELYQKLRPGGVLVVTINDCDRGPGVKLVEQKWCYYTPLNLVLDYSRNLGYNIEFTWTDTGASTWIEMKKPGEFSSLRGGQALAKVIPK